jgi:plastocyanin
MSRTVAAAIAAFCALGTAACGGSSPSGPGAGDVVITIRATGPSPSEVTVPRGGRVTFTNGDSRAHAVSSDPIQTHTDCPALNEVGTLNPGQSRSTGTLDVARVCGFHDHNNETDPTFKGRIIVQ